MSTEVPLNAGSQLTQSLSADNLQKPAVLANNQIGSEYQRSYSWKLPMVQVNKPIKGPSVSEYQREFTWKRSPTPSAPVNEVLSDSKPAPQPSVIENKSIDVARPVDSYVKTLSTNDVVRKTPEPKEINVILTEINIKQNSTIIAEPDILVSNSGKFTSSAGIDKWKDGLRNGSTEQSFDPIEKKIVVLEGSRLSKRSRCRSMYSLRDELKTKELASQLSNPYETEYNQQFMNWNDYYEHERSPLQRRGSWSAPLDNFKLLDGLDRNESFYNSQSSSNSRKTDTTSVKNNRRQGIMRPSTSAEYRNYRSDYNEISNDKFSKLNLNDYYTKTNSIEMQKTKSEFQKTKSSEMQKTKSHEMQKSKSSGGSPLRNSVINQNDLTSQETIDHRRRNISAIEYPGKPRNRDTHIDERRRDYEHLYDKNRLDTFNNEKSRDLIQNNRRDDYSDLRYLDNRFNNDHRLDYITERQLDNGYDLRYNRQNHDEYDRPSSQTAHLSDKEYYYGRYINQTSSSGHSRNTSYSSTSDLDPSRSAHHPSYLDHLRHRASGSDSSSVSTPSCPATPNGFYDNDQRWRKSNGLDPRIYKEQTYSPVISSKYSRSNLPLEDDKERYRSSNLSPTRNKFYLDDKERYYHQSSSHNKFHLDNGDDYDNSHLYIPSKHQPQPLLSSMLKDNKSLVAKSPTPSIPRSYQSTYSSPPLTRASSPTRNLYNKKPHNYHYEASSPTLSPTYSSRPPSRANSVSSHATSIDDESAVLTDILRDADSLTLRNLTDQLKVFKHREFSPPNTAKNTSRSTPSTRRQSVTNTKNPTKTTKGVKSSSVPGTPGAAQKKNTKTTKTTKSVSSNTVSSKSVFPKSVSSKSSVTSSYREAYRDYSRPEPTDFTAAREALNRAKLKVEEMLELVSNNGSIY